MFSLTVIVTILLVSLISISSQQSGNVPRIFKPTIRFLHDLYFDSHSLPRIDILFNGDMIENNSIELYLTNYFEINGIDKVNHNKFYLETLNTLKNNFNEWYENHFYLMENSTPKEMMDAEHANNNGICPIDSYDDCIFSSKYKEINIYNRISSLFSSYSPKELTNMNRVAFIHSCYLKERPTTIIDNLLTKLDLYFNNDYKLDQIWVINHGYELPISIKNRYQNVNFVEFSKDISRFEVRTLQIIHYFSTLLVELDKDTTTHILYLHTKGSSYNPPLPGVTDWVDFMLYFLVEENDVPYHLLESNGFDTVGVSYNSVYKHYSGNFWWASHKYIATIDNIKSSAKKFDCEDWLLRNSEARIYNLFDGKHGYNQNYPRYLYDGSIPNSFDNKNYKFNCSFIQEYK